MEINPNDLTKEKINNYVDLGINRFSIGVQSFCDDQLKKMNRSHSYNDIIKCISLIKKRFNKFQFRFNLWIAKYVNLTLARNIRTGYKFISFSFIMLLFDN